MTEWSEHDVAPEPSPAEADRIRRAAVRAGRRILLTEGPTAVSLSSVARAADCDDADLVRLFGTDDALAGAVAADLVAGLRRHTDQVRAVGPAAFAPMLDSLFDEPELRRVFIRSVLDDNDVIMSLTHDNPANALVRWIEQIRGRPRGRVPLRTRICAFGSVALLFGWLADAEQLMAEFRLDPIGLRRCNEAIARAAGSVANVALSSGPAFRPTRDHVRRESSLHDASAHGVSADAGGAPAEALRHGPDGMRLAAATADALARGSVAGRRKLRLISGLTPTVDVAPALATFTDMLLAAPGGTDRAQP